MSDAESLGAQDRIPREAIEAAARALYKRAQDEAGGDPSWDNLYATEQESWLGDARAAYPLIRRAVCQELASAICAMPPRYRPQDVAVEVRSFAASPGGERNG